MTFDDPIQFWLLLASVAGVAFILGRATGGGQDGGFGQSRAERLHREHEAGEMAFSSLSVSKQAEVDRLLRDGKVINAVKIIRDETSAGLKEAKLTVDHRRKALRGDAPY